MTGESEVPICPRSMLSAIRLHDHCNTGKYKRQPLWPVITNSLWHHGGTREGVQSQAWWCANVSALTSCQVAQKSGIDSGVSGVLGRIPGQEGKGVETPERQERWIDSWVS